MGIGLILVITGSLLIYSYINSVRRKGFSMRHFFLLLLPFIGAITVFIGIVFMFTSGQ